MMTTQTHDWTCFRRQIFIKADCSTVFEAWTKAAKITEWFIAEATYTSPDARKRAADETVEAGDSYHWRWHQDLEIRGDILELIPNQKLRFTFGDKGDGSGEKIIVTVNFRDLGHETLLELQQNNIPDTDTAKVTWYLGCNMGWSFFMTNLKALLEHGADLRENDAERAYASRAISLA